MTRKRKIVLSVSAGLLILIGRGVKRAMISIESQLLERTDRYARTHHLNRSQLIAEELRQLVAG